jgi:ribosomal-protein-alanine N-acetyltransferase
MLPPIVRHESGRQFVSRVLREQGRGEGPAFTIRALESGGLIGQIRFVNWSHADRSAEVGYWIRRRCWGTGLGTEALWLVCRFGFRSLGLHRIEAHVVDGNLRSLRILEKVGFRSEGRRRKVTQLSGKWVDGLTFGLLRGEFDHQQRPSFRSADSDGSAPAKRHGSSERIRRFVAPLGSTPPVGFGTR